ENKKSHVSVIDRADCDIHLILKKKAIIIFEVNAHESNQFIWNFKKIALHNYRVLCGSRITYLSHIHLDPFYISKTDPLQLCHRQNETNPDTNTAGEYGTLLSRCDAPYTLSNETISYLQNTFKNIDFIIYTGDFVRHDRDKSIPRTHDH
ncbi:13282_t:CDS:2, partial [Racocetra fulgida]